jgi:hypothetical protein
MSSAHILSTFQSTFPGLYQAPKKGAEDEPSADAPAPEPVAQQDDEPDQYSTRIAGITSKVRPGASSFRVRRQSTLTYNHAIA